MGARSTNPTQSFFDDFSRSGTEASGPNAAAPVSVTGTVTPYTPGDGYQYYVFTNTGTFTVSNTSLSNADILVVGGGGAGGQNNGGGGGGGGAVVFSPNTTIPISSYNITVGTGGTGLVKDYSPFPLPGSPTDGNEWRGYPGTPSSFGPLSTAPGGSAAGRGSQPNGGGGSGGAGGSPGGASGGPGPQPFRNGPGTPGNNGTQVPTFAGIGNISPPGHFGGGGGGGTWDGPNGPFPGGSGGGGPSGQGGTDGSDTSGTPGTTNTGGGGGGILDPSGTAAPTPTTFGGSGGPGVVMIRYPIS